MSQACSKKLNMIDKTKTSRSHVTLRSPLRSNTVPLSWSRAVTVTSEKCCQLSDTIMYKYKCHSGCWAEYSHWIQMTLSIQRINHRHWQKVSGLRVFFYLIIYSRPKNKFSESLGVGWPLEVCSGRQHWSMRFFQMQMWVLIRFVLISFSILFSHPCYTWRIVSSPQLLRPKINNVSWKAVVY